MTELAVRRVTKIAISAFIFSAVASGSAWIYADRVADQARSDAVMQAEESRKAIDAANCDLYGLLLDADGASGPAQTPYRVKLRALLESAYLAPGCRPPLSERLPFPPDGPGATPTTAPPTDEPTDEPTGGPGS